MFQSAFRAFINSIRAFPKYGAYKAVDGSSFCWGITGPLGESSSRPTPHSPAARYPVYAWSAGVRADREGFSWAKAEADLPRYKVPEGGEVKCPPKTGQVAKV